MSLRVWLPLTKDLRNQGLDDVTVTNNGATFNSAGKLGGCYYFNGSAYLYGESISANMKSASLWIKLNNTDAQVVFADYKSKLGFGIYSNYLVCSCVDSTIRTTYPKTLLETNTWIHIAIIRKESLIELYINGDLQTPGTSKDSWTANMSDLFTIGARSNGSTKMIGYMNDFRMYDHCLSEMEVKQLSQGLVLHYPLNRGGWGQKNLLKNSSVENSHKYNSNSLIYYYYDFSGNLPTGTYTCSFDIKSSNGTESAYCSYATNANTIQRICSLTNIPSEWTHYSFTFNVASTSSNDIFFAHYTGHGSPFNAKNEGYIYVKNIKLENGSIETPWSPAESDTLATIMGLNGTTEYDTSGYCNNGVRTGTFSWTSDTPKYSVSTQFSANTIKDTTFNFISNTWTVAFWYYFDTAPRAYQGFLCLSRNAGSDADKKFAAMPNSSYIWFKFENTSLTVSSLKTKTWTHIVMTFDGTNGKVYENGVLKGTTSAVSSIYTDCDDFIVGARANAIDATATTCQLVGNMSDVRIYATALSPSDVKSLYQNCATIDPDGTIRGQIRS